LAVYMHDYIVFGLTTLTGKSPIKMSLQSKAYVRSRLIAGIAGSNSVEGMNVRLLCLLCVL
jgi:hypothetical protein